MKDIKNTERVNMQLNHEHYSVTPLLKHKNHASVYSLMFNNSDGYSLTSDDIKHGSIF